MYVNLIKQNWNNFLKSSSQYVLLSVVKEFHTVVKDLGNGFLTNKSGCEINIHCTEIIRSIHWTINPTFILAYCTMVHFLLELMMKKSLYALGKSVVGNHLVFLWCLLYKLELALHDTFNDTLKNKRPPATRWVSHQLTSLRIHLCNLDTMLAFWTPYNNTMKNKEARIEGI